MPHEYTWQSLFSNSNFARRRLRGDILTPHVSSAVWNPAEACQLPPGWSLRAPVFALFAFALSA
jgi:hypothetical protein